MVTKGLEMDEAEALTMPLGNELGAAEQSAQQLDTDVVELERNVPDQERVAYKKDSSMAGNADGQTVDDQADSEDEAIDDGEYHPVDIFAWANNLYQYKNQLRTELFLINKNGVVYRTKLDKDVQKQLQPLFIDEILNYVLTGSGEGLVVRDFEDGEAQANVLQRTHWENVERLCEVMHWLNAQEDEIELFADEQHDLKRIKGALLRCVHPAFKRPFYAIKALPAAQLLKGDGVWMVQGNNFKPFSEAAALRVPFDNQMLLVDDDLFVFNQAKLDRLFGYNAKKNSVAAKKVAEIEQHFKLSFADGMDMQSLVKGNKPAINKLQKVEIGELTQDALIDHADELGLGLMQDEEGAIIIENTKDLNKFVNLLNDDYMESQLTGIRYEVRGKRPLPPPKDEA